MIILNEEQTIGVEAIKKFILDKDPTNDVLTVQGIGGAGKTTSVTFAVEDFAKDKIIIGGTISHSAKSVLSKSLESANIKCYTVAQLLNLKQNVDDETGAITFIPSKNSNNDSPLNSAEIIIIDECSMIGEDLHAQIYSRKKLGSKIIYLGDEYQLPPIGDENSDSTTFDHTKVTLNNAMRYSGPIADLGARIRKEISNFNEGEACSQYVFNEWQTNELKNSCRTSVVDEKGNGYIFINDLDVVMDIAVKAFKEDNSPTAMRLIAFRNSTIIKLNDYVRSLLYQTDDLESLPQFMPGELVICDGGYATRVQGRNIDRPCIYNNSIFRVDGTVEVNRGPHGIASLMPILNPPVDLQEGERIFVLDKTRGSYDFNSRLDKLKSYALEDGRQWKNFYHFKDSWAWFNYNYSCNSHRAQGMTFKDVIVFEKDILEVSKINTKVKLQSLYVACTRAQRRVYIYNSKYKVDNTKLPKALQLELGL